MTDPRPLDLSGVARAMRDSPEPTTGTVPLIEPDDDNAAAARLVGQRRAAWQAIVPRRFHAARLDDLTGRAGHDDLVAWSTDDQPPNLVLIGPVGVGKSHAATAAVRPHYGGGADLEWTPVGEMLDRLDWRRPDSHQWLDRLMSVDLLVVDDLGTERANEWTGERLYAVVNRRWLAQLPTVATANMEPTALAESLGERTYSRLVGGALMLRLAGHDRRR